MGASLVNIYTNATRENSTSLNEFNKPSGKSHNTCFVTGELTKICIIVSHQSWQLAAVDITSELPVWDSVECYLDAYGYKSSSTLSSLSLWHQSAFGSGFHFHLQLDQSSEGDAKISQKHLFIRASVIGIGIEPLITKSPYWLYVGASFSSSSLIRSKVSND